LLLEGHATLAQWRRRLSACVVSGLTVDIFSAFYAVLRFDVLS